MGLEAECRVWHDGRTCIGKAHLEPEELLFRGDFRLKIPVRDMKTTEVRRGQLVVTWVGGEARFELGPASETWMLKIRYPKGLMDKLGIKPGMRVAALGIADQDFMMELAMRTSDIVRTRPKNKSDAIFYGFDTKEALDQVAGLKPFLKPAGAIWTVYPKGQKHLTQADVMAACKAAGLVDTKVVSFSATHSSLKWVIPLAERK